jgi:hypothetical protein
MAREAFFQAPLAKAANASWASLQRYMLLTIRTLLPNHAGRPFADNGKKGKGKIYKATLDGEGLMLDLESGHKHTTPMKVMMRDASPMNPMIASRSSIPDTRTAKFSKWAKECKEGATGRKCNGAVAIWDYIFYKVQQRDGVQNHDLFSVTQQ